MLVIMALTCVAHLFPISNFYTFGAFRVLEHDMNSVQRLIEHPETLGFIHRVYLRVSCYYENDSKQQLFLTDYYGGLFLFRRRSVQYLKLEYIYIYIIHIHTYTREGTQKFPELLKK